MRVLGWIKRKPKIRFDVDSHSRTDNSVDNLKFVKKIDTADQYTDVNSGDNFYHLSSKDLEIFNNMVVSAILRFVTTASQTLLKESKLYSVETRSGQDKDLVKVLNPERFAKMYPEVVPHVQADVFVNGLLFRDIDKLINFKNPKQAPHNIALYEDGSYSLYDFANSSPIHIGSIDIEEDFVHILKRKLNLTEEESILPLKIALLKLKNLDEIFNSLQGFKIFYKIIMRADYKKDRFIKLRAIFFYIKFLKNLKSCILFLEKQIGSKS